MKAAVIGFLLAGSISAGCTSPSPESATKPEPVTVAVSQVDVTDVASVFEAGGIMRARTTAPIASRVMAPITQVLGRPGDRVRRGAPLVMLDARGIQADKGRAEATSVSAAEAARAAEADVRGVESTVALARLTRDRMAELHGKRSATQQELDQAVAALAAAEAQRTSAQARLASANAARDAAMASAEAATVTASYAVLTAPFDGLITERHADPGAMATPGTPLLTLEDPTSYHLEVQLDEARAVLVEVGQAVSVRLDTFNSGEWIKGGVGEIDRVDPASHAFLVKIDLPSSSALRAGLFGRARFSGPARRALTVPTSALINRGQLTFVYAVDPEGRARLRPISLGNADRDRAEVLAGLHQGEIIVTAPPASLTDGAQVSRGQP